ncbi:MAG TPA: alpha/beta fold hydrolase [Candidatus Dormibacteraeota bacterium]|nr:alpha/beta fold hydrolase [Candidatus Dormibacteraeota bacterium]
MPDFASAGVRIHYQTAGTPTGPPVILVHGFASDYQLNWVGSRWQQTLEAVGFRLVGPDCRGHGKSDKPHHPEAYSTQLAVTDLIGLLDHLNLPRASLIGYSMGARICVALAVEHPERVQHLVLGGTDMVGIGPHAALIAARLRGDELISDAAANDFWKFAVSRPDNDLRALAACMESSPKPFTTSLLGGILAPTLVACGEYDAVAPDGATLAAHIVGSRYLSIPGRDHMSAITSRDFKNAVVGFLSEGTYVDRE